MTKPELAQLTSSDPAFYAFLGPFLARHEVHVAIGGVPWDEPTKTWLVLRDDAGVIAFCAVNQKKASTWLESLYVHRAPTQAADRRLRTRLVAAAVEAFGHDRDLRAKVRSETVPAYTAAGFAEVSETANFTTLVRPATIRKTAA